MELNKHTIAERFAHLPRDKQSVFLEALRQQGIDFSQLPIVRSKNQESRTLSYAQLRQWFLWRMDPQSSAYHITGAVTLKGTLDSEALRGSFAALVARHEALHTVFRDDGESEAVQVVQAENNFALSDIDLSHVPKGEREAAIESQVTRLCNDPFDLEQGPLLRVGLLRLAEEEQLLVVVMHHIVSDGWSIQLIIDEFAADYSARVMGETWQPPALPIQYADYALWQRQWMDAGEKECQLAYWKAELGDEHPVLQLPTDRPRRNDGYYHTARHHMVLPEPLVRGLRQRVQTQGATLFMTLLTGLQVLLYRYTGQENIRIGVPIANRHRTETQGVVGLFVNTQVMCNQLNGRLSLAEALEQAKRAALGAQEHQDLPFEQLVEALQPERSLSHTPLFQVMFNYQQQDHSALKTLPGLELSTRPLEKKEAKFELTLNVEECNDGYLKASFIYAEELFDSITIGRLARHYVVFLKALAEMPERALSDIELLDKNEQHQLKKWAGNTQRYPDILAIHHLIERQAAAASDITALVFEDQSLSYAELNTRANRLANYLIDLGVKPETRVGIAMERSVEMVAGLLAILKAGGTYVPLDPDYPAERLDYMVEDSGITMLVTQQHIRETLPVTDGVSIIELDRLDVAHHASTNPEVVLHSEHLAYVIYTSGSTGRPKGVGITHGALSNYVEGVLEVLALSDDARRFAMVSTIAADLGHTMLFGALYKGQTLHLISSDSTLDPDAFTRYMHDHEIDVLKIVPSHLRALMSVKSPLNTLPRRCLVLGGEVSDWSLVKWISDLNPSCQIVNHYGPTETTVGALTQRYESADQRASTLPIGAPLRNMQIRVLDPWMNLVPQGVNGELYLGGVGLARGYLGRLDMTAERFVADPFSEGERLYRTGDSVRQLPDGSLEFLSRMDDQVKIRGYRVELGEVQAQLLLQLALREAVVVSQDGASGSRLVAYVVPQAGIELDATSIREQLSQHLPDYMVPGAVVTLDALPLNANGKVDRKALPAPDLAGSQRYEPPQGEVEVVLAKIWSEIFGVERIGRHDNFFELGGHSLLALKVLEKMRQWGLTAQVRTLFQSPELTAFAKALTQASERQEISIPPNRIPDGCSAIQPEMLPLIELNGEEISAIEAAVPGGARNIQDIYPLAPLQEGILFHHRLQEEGDAYVTQHLLGFDSREQLEAFTAGFNQLVTRHDILRTAVLWEGLREPVQVVCRHAELELEWLDFDYASSLSVAEQLNAEVDPDHHRLDVRHAPMLRAVAAYDAGHGRWLLQLPSHHLVMDHITLERLVEEIALIQQGRGDELPQPLPFRNFVAQTRLGVSQEEHETFFRERLGDIEEPTAPFGLLDVRGDGSDIEEVRLPLPAELAQQVRQQAQRHGVSTASLFHLAWALVLSKTTGRDDVVFGTVLFGRMQGIEGSERALGMFINTLPVCVKTGSQSVDKCLRHTHDTLSELMHHEHASLGLAQRCSGLPGGAPLFSSLLNYRYSVPQQEKNPIHTWEGMETLGVQERTNYPIGMSVDDQGEGFQLVGQVSRTIGAQRLCDYMEAAVAGIVASLQHTPQQAISEISLLGEEERRLLSKWGVNSYQHPNTQPVHHLIERHTEVTPEATALVFEDQSLSYAELNTRANQLAHYLIELGVKPETRVGIAIERSIEMVVGLLATLKAGGAYVPLDPEYPSERLAFIAEDSGIELLLTQRHLHESLPVADGLSVIELDRLDVAHHAATNPAVALHGEHLAYVIYTSGSTGRPKGAAIRHDALTNCMVWMQETYQLTDTDAVLHKAPFGFDVSVWEIFWPLSVGARLVIAQPGDHRDPARIIELIQRHGVTTLNFVPSMLKAFLAYPDVKTKTRLKHIMCGGEAVPATLQQDVAECLDGAHLHDLYGPTETTIHVTHWWCRDDAHRQIPIGRSISGTRTYVLDGDLNLAPPGVAGELYLGGVSLARGYLNRSDLTSERFIADPFAAGERLYRTGDLVRWREDGQLEYLGRLDHQVKIRGLRIELGEIEAELLSQPEVREAVVVAQEGPYGSRLVAYVVSEADSELNSTSLREALGQRLPDYMVPGVMVTLDALPLNANGKVDRKALPEPELTSGLQCEPPQGETEEALATIWSEVLGVKRVGRHDNFFELGGHSLLAVQMVAHVQADMQVELHISEVFKNPLLHALAECIVGLNHGHSLEQSLSDIDSFIDSMDTVQ
ncbi:amino acid adenylation domain-containing protein [Halomonas alkaliantarctica]|uniref:Amino acid adenylation domain-containing protein n=1 Tax=Halomonas alkaliantarctica TaxID=232346 RepID=A0ABY8LR12_9GAMM|nr:non-ribosomal peptide synthetase [Halomonas alkaliantarctica]WGI26271.1 amino acid adenylation domain-containing protein [Halomonas alkaliantarctica]